VTWQPINAEAFAAGFVIAETAFGVLLGLLVGLWLIRRLLRAAGW
jgi:hypothetical protein